jgi:hypothetical protein
MGMTERLDRILTTLEPELAERLIDVRANLREAGIAPDLGEQLDRVIDDLLEQIRRSRSRSAPPRHTRKVSLSSHPDGTSNA